MSVVNRIATLEGQIKGMIDEIADLKIQVGDSDAQLFESSLFSTIPFSHDVKELFVLFDFETGGKFIF